MESGIEGSKIIKLSVGQSFKSYKELCLFLGQKFRTGKSKQLQLKDWERYLKFSKVGNRFIITEIYPEPKEKVDNRKGHSGTSEGSRKNNNVYGLYVDQILLNYFADCEETVVYRTTNQLSFIAGLINWNYSVASSYKDKYYSFTNAEMNGVINKVAMWDFLGKVKPSIKKIIRLSLKRLADKGYIDYEESHMLSYNYQTRVATEDEEVLIRNIENSVLEEMQVTRNKLLYNDKLRNEYYADVEKLVEQEIAFVDKVFVGYKIKIKEKIKSENNQENNRAMVNQLFKERTKEKLSKIPVKTKEKVGDYIGEPNPFWDKFTLGRLDSNYLIYSDYVIKSLLSLNFKDIKEAIVKQKIISPKKMERKKMIKKFIENEEDTEMKDIWKDLYKEDLG
jgi:hypothetical protein